MEALNLTQLQQGLPQALHWHVLDNVHSTNQYLLDLAKQGQLGIHICLAEQQTAGRGRRGRTWESPPGANMYLSILWPYNGHIAQLSGLSIAVGVAMVNTLKKHLIEGVQLKWPNDLIAKDKKLGGILVETTPIQNGIGTVIGVGLNIDLANAETKISQPYIDLASLSSQTINRNGFINICITEILQALALFRSQGLAPFLPSFTACDYLLGQEVHVINGSFTLCAKYLGINALGELLVEHADGNKAILHAGEVSIRKR